MRTLALLLVGGSSRAEYNLAYREEPPACRLCMVGQGSPTPSSGFILDLADSRSHVSVTFIP